MLTIQLLSGRGGKGVDGLAEGQPKEPDDVILLHAWLANDDGSGAALGDRCSGGVAGACAADVGSLETEVTLLAAVFTTLAKPDPDQLVLPDYWFGDLAPAVAAMRPRSDSGKA